MTGLEMAGEVSAPLVLTGAYVGMELDAVYGKRTQTVELV